MPASREPFPLTAKVRPRILIDQDPVYTQSWVTTGDPLDIFGDHDLYFTVGGNIGSPRCSVPTFGIEWRPIWNPIVLDWWWPPQEITNDRFTTIADWYTQGYIAFEGRVLGPKVEEFHKFLELPRLAGEEIELVLTINPDDPDIQKLTSLGWRIRHPDTVRTPEMYRDYVRRSHGEFTCAKGGYAGTRCGWFSDRSEVIWRLAGRSSCRRPDSRICFPQEKACSYSPSWTKLSRRFVPCALITHCTRPPRVRSHLSISIRTKSCAGCLPRRVSRE